MYAGRCLDTWPDYRRDRQYIASKRPGHATPTTTCPTWTADSRDRNVYRWGSSPAKGLTSTWGRFANRSGWGLSTDPHYARAGRHSGPSNRPSRNIEKPPSGLHQSLQNGTIMIQVFAFAYAKPNDGPGPTCRPLSGRGGSVTKYKNAKQNSRRTHSDPFQFSPHRFHESRKCKTNACKRLCRAGWQTIRSITRSSYKKAMHYLSRNPLCHRTGRRPFHLAALALSPIFQ